MASFMLWCFQRCPPIASKWNHVADKLSRNYFFAHVMVQRGLGSRESPLSLVLVVGWLAACMVDGGQRRHHRGGPVPTYPCFRSSSQIAGESGQESAGTACSPSLSPRSPCSQCPPWPRDNSRWNKSFLSLELRHLTSGGTDRYSRGEGG